MALIKDVYSRPFFEKFLDELTVVYPKIDRTAFLNDIFTEEFQNKEYKERMRHSAQVLHKHLPDDFQQSAGIFAELVDNLDLSEEDGFQLGYMFLPDYIELYGINDYETSIQAFEKITQLITCEFAVRPFIIKYGNRMMEQMFEWSNHKHPMVRRLASEGCRSRLPWAMALPELKKDPKPILPILENLKNDKSESVRKSVANNLNDIAKDNPETVIEIACRWYGDNKQTDWIVKHACRTLLKQAHPEALKLFGVHEGKYEVSDFKIETKSVPIGKSLTFSFALENNQDTEQTFRIEYAIYHMKANGKLTPKIFKISERKLKPFEKVIIKRNHPFKIITTRKYYPGEHRLGIIINGKETALDTFELLSENK